MCLSESNSRINDILKSYGVAPLLNIINKKWKGGWPLASFTAVASIMLQQN